MLCPTSVRPCTNDRLIRDPRLYRNARTHVLQCRKFFYPTDCKWLSGVCVKVSVWVVCEREFESENLV